MSVAKGVTLAANAIIAATRRNVFTGDHFDIAIIDKAGLQGGFRAGQGEAPRPVRGTQLGFGAESKSRKPHGDDSKQYPSGGSDHKDRVRGPEDSALHQEPKVPPPEQLHHLRDSQHGQEARRHPDREVDTASPSRTPRQSSRRRSPWRRGSQTTSSTTPRARSSIEANNPRVLSTEVGLRPRRAHGADRVEDQGQEVPSHRLLCHPEHVLRDEDGERREGEVLPGARRDDLQAQVHHSGTGHDKVPRGGAGGRAVLLARRDLGEQGPDRLPASPPAPRTAGTPIPGSTGQTSTSTSSTPSS